MGRFLSLRLILWLLHATDFWQIADTHHHYLCGNIVHIHPQSPHLLANRIEIAYYCCQNHLTISNKSPLLIKDYAEI